MGGSRGRGFVDWHALYALWLIAISNGNWLPKRSPAPHLCNTKGLPSSRESPAGLHDTFSVGPGSPV
jgi:hypothetical protein